MFHKLLAKELTGAKRKGNSDGDYYNADQQGIAVIEKTIHKVKGVKQTVIIVSRILESHAKTPDAKVQAPGTTVKKIYALSKRDWAIDELKTDLLNIAGVDEGDVAPADITAMFEEVFDPEQFSLVGVAHSFNTSKYEREGKQTLTNVYFNEAKGDVNEPDAVAKRKAEIIAKYAATKS